jgi:disulfide oxidoreductase YuzD
MTQNITVPLSDRAYRRIKHWAETRQQDVGDAIAEFLANNLPHNDTLVIPPAAADAKVEQEKAAYLRLYPQLKMRYKGQYVAIHNGRLVDHDTDYGTLFERIDDQYPDTFVWLTRVEDEPMRTIVVRCR